MRRVILFFATNLLVVFTISILLKVFGIQPYLTQSGVSFSTLMAFCLIWGFTGSFISLAISKMMAKMTMGIQLVHSQQDPRFGKIYAMVEEAAARANLPVMPEVGIYNSSEVNAFATGPGRRNSLVAVSTGLLYNMDDDAVAGVIGHEVAHIANGDMVTMTLLQGVINSFVMFLARAIAIAMSSRSNGERNSAPSYMLIFLLEMVLGFLGMMIICWFSRYREFRADSGGAKFMGKNKMIGALRGLARVYDAPVSSKNSESLATLKISGRGGLMSLFSTHPPLEQRIARLAAAS